VLDLSLPAVQSLLSIFTDPVLNAHRRCFSRSSPVCSRRCVVYSCPVVVGGDFNLRVHDENSADARQLAGLLLSFDMIQHVRSPTHCAGNTLDLVMTFADRPPNKVSVDPPGAISDHALVISSIPVSVDSPPLSERLVRGWRRVDRVELARRLSASPLCCPSAQATSDSDVDQLFDTYNTVLLEVADQLVWGR